MYVLAHQGGWDELLWFVAPILLVMAWVRWAERKARGRAAKPKQTHDAGTGTQPRLPAHDHDQ